MAKPAPVITSKGERYPGSGRKRGTPNRVSVELKTLVTQLVTDPNYQAQLRKDFRRRKLLPTIEAMAWNYHLGKPTQPVAIAGGLAIDVNARLDEERRIFSQLDIAELEQLAAESQALVDRAAALVKVRAKAGTPTVMAPTPQDIVVVAQTPDMELETLGKCVGSDNESSVNLGTDEPG